MACDICGKNSEPLVDLRSEYRTEKIGQICSECERVVNRQLDTIRGVTHKIQQSLLKRFMDALRGKRTDGDKTR